MRTKIATFLTVAFLLVCTGCVNVEKEKDAAIADTKEVFMNSQPASSSYYLPQGFKLKEEGEFNSLLQKGNQRYILFINPEETADSSELYEQIKNNAKKLTIDKTFKKKSEFGFITAEETAKEQFELSVGIGGIKITTVSKADHLAVDSKNMMRIVSSIKQ